MSVFAAAYRNQGATGWTRIELVLALYDGAIDRLEKAKGALARRDTAGAAGALVRARFMVAALASGTNPGGDAASMNLLRLYEYVLHCLEDMWNPKIDSAISVLSTVREGFQGIREEAVTLERSGVIPSADVVLQRSFVA